MKRSLYLLLILPCLAYASSVRMINNSPYTLRAVVRGGDGSFLSEVVIQSQKETVWTDSYGQYGLNGGANASVNSNYRSKTPYTVLWYCLSGSSYAVCDTVSTGAVVTAQSCSGPRMCQPERKEAVPPNQPEGNYLYEPPTSPPLDQ